MGKLLNWLELASFALAVLTVLAMMLIVSYDAIARYAFNAPLPWAFEIISYYLLSFALYFAVAMTFRSGDHVSIDLFRGFFPSRLRSILDAIWCVLSAIAFALIALGAWRELSHSYGAREFFPGAISWPAWVAYLPVVVGAVLTALRLLFHAIVLIVRGEDTDVVEFGEPTE